MECAVKTLKGTRCKNSAIKGTDKCKVHSKKQKSKSSNGKKGDNVTKSKMSSKSTVEKRSYGYIIIDKESWANSSKVET